MKKLIIKFFDKTFWKFILVGIANTLFGTGIMFIFYNVFHFSYWFSSASNYFFGSILSYILNRLFTFKSGETTIKTLPKFVISISLCYLLAYGIAKPITSYIFSKYVFLLCIPLILAIILLIKKLVKAILKKVRRK